ncbi:MAG TPA: hypothetical protein VF911_14750 [Thermoanaerobaculia bacterium]|jgi:hypothetical protein
MKKIYQFLAIAVLAATPVFAQTYDEGATSPTGTCTTTADASVVISRYTRSAVSRANNTVQCTGTFNGKVTAQVAIQYQALWLMNQDPSKSSVVDTTGEVRKTWPVWTKNANCTTSWCCTSCPPGETAYNMTEPIPTSTILSTSTSGSRCYRAVTMVTWNETFRYPWSAQTYTRTVRAQSPWTGSDCAAGVQ